MNFRKKSTVTIAFQWFKNGDHPDDGPLADSSRKIEGKVVRYFRHPEIKGFTICSRCNHPMHEHGWIDTPKDGGHIVCPGDWLTAEITDKYYPFQSDIFEKNLEKDKDKS